MSQQGDGMQQGGGMPSHPDGGMPKKMPPQSVTPILTSQNQRRTCTACKASKVKCDRAAPVCGRCARLRLTCVQQPRAQGRPIKYNAATGEITEGPPDRVSAGKDVKPGRTLICNESSTQWAADYMAFTFSNLLKAGAVHRYKTFAVLRIWMLFSLYYGVDLTKGFLSVALALMDASIQDLQRLPEMVLDAPMALAASEGSTSNPLDPSVLQPFIDSLDDGVSAVICCVGCRGGTGKVFCNDKFKATFFSSEDLTYRTLNESTLPVYMYACIIAPEDRAEFVDSLTNVCFGTQTALPQVTHIVKVLDKHGNEFLAIVRLRCLTLNNGEYGADILTIEPAPSSKYVLQTTGLGASNDVSAGGGSEGQAIASSSALSVSGASASGGSANSSVTGDADAAPSGCGAGEGGGGKGGGGGRRVGGARSAGRARGRHAAKSIGTIAVDKQQGRGSKGGGAAASSFTIPFSEMYPGPVGVMHMDDNGSNNARGTFKRSLPDDMSGGGGGLPPPHSRGARALPFPPLPQHQQEPPHIPLHQQQQQQQMAYSLPSGGAGYNPPGSGFASMGTLGMGAPMMGLPPHMHRPPQHHQQQHPLPPQHYPQHPSQQQHQQQWGQPQEMQGMQGQGGGGGMMQMVGGGGGHLGLAPRGGPVYDEVQVPQWMVQQGGGGGYSPAMGGGGEMPPQG